MFVGMVANKLEGRKKKAATATPKKVEKAKTVTPPKRVAKVDRFLGNVKVINDDDNRYFNASFFDVIKVEMKTRPQAQAQRKSTVVGGELRFYNPIAFDKKCLARELKKQLKLLGGGGFKIFLGAVLVSIRFNFRKPMVNPTSIKKHDYYTKRPDIDNLQKFVFDAMTGLFYKDDSQLVSVNVCKLYDDHDHVEITIAQEKTSVVVGGPSDVDGDDDDVDDDDSVDLFELNCNR